MELCVLIQKTEIMNAKKIIPALFLMTLSLAAKPAGNTADAVEKVKNKVVLPAQLFENKSENAVRLSFKINANGKAEDVIINAESEKVKQFVQENLEKIDFNEKGQVVNLLVRFKLQ